MSREESIEAAKRAEQLLGELKDTFAAVEADYLAAMRHGKTQDEREESYRGLRALDDVIAKLRVTVGRGKAAQAELDRQALRERTR